MKKEKILITGSSGFIGMNLSQNLLKNGFKVFGIDNMNNYYSVSLKMARLNQLKKYTDFDFLKMDITDSESLKEVFRKFKPDKVVNLAAQAGVRYSLENPRAYIDANIIGFLNVLEACRHNGVNDLIYASSSSVYGGNTKTPFSVDDRVDKPISIYAATKKSNELMAYSYSHLYGMNTTGLRFFTVYGPWGRPDMAMYIFADKIKRGELIPVFNKGNMQRDFTYIDDIVEGIKSAIEKSYRCEVFNLGNNKEENLLDMIDIIQSCIGRTADFNFMEMQPGDVKRTVADIKYSEIKLGYNPKIKIAEGIPKFINWYTDYNNGIM